jgi:DnaK suppressor protein
MGFDKRGSTASTVADGVDAASGLTQQEFAELREALRDKRAAIYAASQVRLSAFQAGAEPGDEMDVAARSHEEGLVLRIADKEQKLLVEIEEALTRFERGEYGVCEGSGEPIGVGRLRLRPWTRYSATYKEQLEREEKVAGVHG